MLGEVTGTNAVRQLRARTERNPVGREMLETQTLARFRTNDEARLMEIWYVPNEGLSCAYAKFTDKSGFPSQKWIKAWHASFVHRNAVKSSGQDYARVVWSSTHWVTSWLVTCSGGTCATRFGKEAITSNGTRPTGIEIWDKRKGFDDCAMWILSWMWCMRVWQTSGMWKLLPNYCTVRNE